MSDVTVACGEACAGCHDECAACKAEMCADCGGCDHQRKLGQRARAAVASLALHQIASGVPAEFGFNPLQKRGPDGRWIKMGGAGSAGGKRVSASRADAPSLPDAPATPRKPRAPRQGDRVPLADGREGEVVGNAHRVAGREGMYVSVRPDGDKKLKEVAVEAIQRRQQAAAQAPAIPAPRASEENGIAARVKTTRNDNGTTTYEIAGKRRDWTTAEAEDLADALDAVADGGSVPPPIPGRVVSDGYNRRTVEEVQPFHNSKGGVTLTVGRDKPSGDPGDMDMTADEARELAKMLRDTADRQRSDNAARKAARADSPEQRAAAAEADRRERRREAARKRREAAKAERMREAMGAEQADAAVAEPTTDEQPRKLTKRQREMATRFDQVAGEYGADPGVARWRDKAIQLVGDMEKARGTREGNAIREQMDTVQGEFVHAMAGAKAAAEMRAAGGSERDVAIARRRASLESRAETAERRARAVRQQLKELPKFNGDPLDDPHAAERARTRARAEGLEAEAKNARRKVESAERDHDTKLVYDEKGNLTGTQREGGVRVKAVHPVTYSDPSKAVV